MMIRAGKPVDEVIGQLIPLLEPGDIIIDGGNSIIITPREGASTLRARGCSISAPGVSEAKRARFGAQYHAGRIA